MKKVIAIILVLILSLSVLTACGGLEDPPRLPPPRERNPNSPVAPPPNPTPNTPEPPPGDDDGDNGENSDLADVVISGNGGTFRVTETTVFSFIPAQSGIWEFSTSDNGNSDPYLELFGRNFDGDYGDQISDDDDSAGDLNALLTRVLNAGDLYFIKARTWGERNTDAFTLTVRQINTQPIPGNGGSVQVDGESYFVFIPSTSGRWEFLTTDNGESDPRLAIYDENGVELYDDDDSGDGVNARIVAQLTAGTTYYVRGHFWFWDDHTRFVINVTLT